MYKRILTLIIVLNIVNLCNGVYYQCRRVVITPEYAKKIFKNNTDCIVSYRYGEIIKFDETGKLNILYYDKKYISKLYSFKFNNIITSCILGIDVNDVTSNCFEIEFPQTLYTSYCDNGEENHINFTETKLCYDTSIDNKELKLNTTIYFNITNNCDNEYRVYERNSVTIIQLEYYNDIGIFEYIHILCIPWIILGGFIMIRLING